MIFDQMRAETKLVATNLHDPGVALIWRGDHTVRNALPGSRMPSGSQGCGQLIGRIKFANCSAETGAYQKQQSPQLACASDRHYHDEQEHMCGGLSGLTTQRWGVVAAHKSKCCIRSAEMLVNMRKHC